MRHHPEPERLTALTRLFGFYTATAWRTSVLLWPGVRRTATADQRWTAGGLRFPYYLAALGWLEAERANLLAAVVQAAQTAPATPVELAGQLTRALFPFFEMRSYWHDGLQANQTTLRLACRTNDLAVQAQAHGELGIMYSLLGQFAEATTSLQDSITLHRQLGDRWGQAVSLNYLGSVYGRRLRRYAEAIPILVDGLRMIREFGDHEFESAILGNLGNVYGRTGRYTEAIACLQGSLTLCRELRNGWGQAHGLNDLGNVYRRLERYAEAIACLQDGLALFRELGHRFGQAASLHGLGVVYRQQGQTAEATACLRESLAIRRDLADRHGQAESLGDLGSTLQAAGQHQQAQAAWREALTIYETLRLPDADELRARLAGLSPETATPAGGG